MAALRPYNDRDILCGRGGKVNRHSGNKVYRRLILARKNLFRDAPRTTRTLLVESIMLALKQDGCRFMKQDENTNEWFEITDNEAMDKICQSFREPDAKSAKPAVPMTNLATVTSEELPMPKFGKRQSGPLGSTAQTEDAFLMPPAFGQRAESAPALKLPFMQRADSAPLGKLPMPFMQRTDSAPLGQHPPAAALPMPYMQRTDSDAPLPMPFNQRTESAPIYASSGLRQPPPTKTNRSSLLGLESDFDMAPRSFLAANTGSNTSNYGRGGGLLESGGVSAFPSTMPPSSSLSKPSQKANDIMNFMRSVDDSRNGPVIDPQRSQGYLRFLQTISENNPQLTSPLDQHHQQPPRPQPPLHVAAAPQQPMSHAAAGPQQPMSSILPAQHSQGYVQFLQTISETNQEAVEDMLANFSTAQTSLTITDREHFLNLMRSISSGTSAKQLQHQVSISGIFDVFDVNNNNNNGGNSNPHHSAMDSTF